MLPLCTWQVLRGFQFMVDRTAIVLCAIVVYKENPPARGGLFDQYAAETRFGRQRAAVLKLSCATHYLQNH